MDLRSTFKVLLRRWWMLLLGLAVTLAGAGYLYTSSPPSYAAGARMLLLLPPDARGPDVVGSPFLYLPNGLDVMASLVAGLPATRAFQEAKSDEGFAATVEVGVDTRSPILIVAVTGTDPDDVLATRDWAVESLQDELLRIQVEEGAPTEQIARGRVFAAEDTPRYEGSTGTRLTLVAIAAGGALTLIATFGIDYLITRSRSRRAAARAEDGGSTVSDLADESTTAEA